MLPNKEEEIQQNIQQSRIKLQKIQVKIKSHFQSGNQIQKGFTTIPQIQLSTDCTNNLISSQLKIKIGGKYFEFYDQLEVINQLPQSQKSNSNPTPSTIQSNQIPKIVLFRQNTRMKGRQPGDKKNIVKNVVTAFLQHLRGLQKQDSDVHNSVNLLAFRISQTKFKNQLINQIVQQYKLRLYFRQFLEEQARVWIQSSRLKNKQIHLEAVKLYIELCQCQDLKQDKRRINQPQEENGLFTNFGNHDLEEEIQKMN